MMPKPPEQLDLVGTELAPRHGSGALHAHDELGVGAIHTAIPLRSRGPDELGIWRALHAACTPEWARGAHRDYHLGLDRLGLSSTSIPQLAEVSARLHDLSGWRIVKIGGFLEGEVFMELLAQCLFPCTDYLRPIEALTYTPEPDMWHDVVGHLPLLAASPAFADFTQAFAAGMVEAREQGQARAQEAMSRLYWFVIEFGLYADHTAIGAGIMSSAAEMARIVRLREAGQLRHSPLSIEALMRATYNPEAMQEEYFTVRHWDTLAAMVAEGALLSS